MSESKPIKVMLVDDHPIVRNGLKAMLLAVDDMELAGEAGSGEEAVTGCYESLPDVILMDLVMPGMDGLETTRALLAKYPDMKIIILTSFPEENLVQRAMEAGAKGYLLKNASLGRLSDAIRTVYSGRPALGPEATEALIQAKSRPAKVGDNLSARELEVLTLMVEGLSNEEIAGRLSISPSTAKNHVGACLAKLGAANRAQAAVMAIEYKLVLR